MAARHHLLVHGFMAICATAAVSTTAAQSPPTRPRTSPTAVRDTVVLPPLPREFRAAWVATVANIDWPSRPGLSAWDQQAELLLILNRAVDLNLNAIVLQVRPAADAFYPSPYEPWSEYLTGQQGRAPEPFYDPLAFAVEESHKRGLELHAWFNPYRARQTGGTKQNALTHLSVTNPKLVKAYGERLLWMDPGEPAVRQQSLRVIADVVRRYDIDGVHIDDYFYPYPIRGADSAIIAFPDSASYARYAASGGRLERDDWRRSNVDLFVKEMYAEVKRLKPWVKVGISPFGIWRPGNPPQIKGFDAYTQLYADARTWLVNGWVDYFTPQLYWPVAQEAQSYPVLLKWWVEENVKGRHLWPGNFTSRVGARGPWRAEEIREQIRLTRAQPGASGNVHFSMRALMGPLSRTATIPPRGAPDTTPRTAATDTALTAAAALTEIEPLASQLIRNEYATRAVVPAMPWLSSVRPAAPLARLVRDTATGGLTLRVVGGGKSRDWLWAVRTRDSTATEWKLTILPASQRLHALTPDAATAAPQEVRVSAINRYGTESRVTVARRRPAVAGTR